LKALEKIPSGTEYSAYIGSNIESIKKHFSDDNKNSIWSSPNDFMVTCLQVNKDEEIFDESTIA